MKHRWTIALLTVGCLAGVVPALSAQPTTGTLQGTVRDPQGALVPGAHLELINEGTQASFAQTSGAEGAYVFNFVPPGSYSLRASAQGFKTATLTQIAVEVGRNTSLDVTLDTGALSEVVEVRAAAATMDTLSAQVSTNVDRQYLQQIPTLNRNALDFAELAPGVEVNYDATSSGTGQNLNIEGQRAVVNGNRSGRNGFYLDGSENTGAFRNNGLNFPNPDAVEEVQIATSNTSAEFGRQPGGSFNVVTRSGTNEFRGTSAYFFRDKRLNANTWDRNRRNLGRAEDELKNFSTTFGGPIRRDRTFFFSSFMAYRNNNADTQNNRRFPTDAMKRGDFSAVPVQLMDPTTGLLLPNNQIPAGLLDPVALRLAEMIPTVANYGDRYFWAFERPSRNNEGLLKIDHQLWGRQRLQLSYFTTWGKETIPDLAGRPFAINNIPAWGPQLNTARQTTAALRHSWIATGAMVVESRASIARLDANRDNANIGRSFADFGAQNWPINQEGARKYLPQIQIADGPLSRNGFLSLFDQGNYQAGVSATWVKGRHNPKFGVELQRERVRQLDDTERVNFTFDGRYASGRTTPPVADQFGFAFADFLMGRTTGFGVSGILDYDISNWNYFGYVQDQWRITPRLTITPGLRYEIYAPSTEANDKRVAFMMGHRSSRFPNAPVNHAFAGDEGIPRGFFKQDRNNLAPRIGVAYDVFGDGRMAVRGGAGIYYSYNPAQINLWTAENNPWRPEVLGGEALLRDPWLTSRSPVYTAPPTPLTSANIANFPWRPPYNAIGFADDFVTPYTAQWNLSVERELWKGVVVAAGYVGNRGYKFPQVLPINFARFREDAQDTAASRDARRPIPDFRDVFLISSTARLWYDALQVSSSLRRDGLLARLTYVLASGSDTADADPTSQSAQTANPLEPGSERGQNQRRHTFRAHYAYTLPFFRDGSRVAGTLLGGWQVSGTVRARSGRPLNVTLGNDWNLDGVGGDRPNQMGEISYPRTENSDGTYQWFDRSAFGLSGGGTTRNAFGSLPRNAVYGAGDWNADLALLKDFRLDAFRRVQLRFEAYNVFNNNNLNDPVLNFSSADFGRILGRRDNRRVQLGVKLYF